MDDRELRALYQGSVAFQGEEAARDACVDPEELAALAEGRGEEAERLRVLDHVMACPRCRQELELLRSLAAASRKRRPAPPLTRPLALAAVVAAVALGGLALWRLADPGSGDVMRGAPAAVTLVSPAAGAPVGAVTAFVWRAVPGAARYRFEVLEPSAEPIVSEVTTDTVLNVPLARLTGAPAPPATWWVRAMLPDGSERASEVRTLGPLRP